MNLNTTKFFNSTQVNISSKMNEYLKKNFGYEVEGDIATLQEAKKSLELEQVELKNDGYMNQKYMENMLMIETISSLLKAHGEKVVSEELDLDDFSKKSPESISKQKKSIQPTLGDNPLEEKADKDRGRRILKVMQHGGYEEFADLLADSMHYAEVVGKDFERELQTARDYFDEADQTESIKEDDDEEKGPDHYRWKNDSQLAVALGRIESAMEALDHAIEYRSKNSHLLMRGGDKAGVGDLMRIKEKLEDIHSNWESQTEYYGM